MENQCIFMREKEYKPRRMYVVSRKRCKKRVVKGEKYCAIHRRSVQREGFVYA